MSAIPSTFRAFVAEQAGATVNRGVRPFAEADLPPGEVEIRVLWSSVNYKDGLATIVGGKVARINPLIAGIDLAGEVAASADPSIPVGRAVAAHGYNLGVSRHGGFAEYQRVPAGWVVPLPPELTPAVRDGAGDGRLHRRALRGPARGARPAARDGAGPGHGRVRWAWHRRGRNPRRARLRGGGGDREPE